MNICFIMDNPETIRHPFIASALQTLNETHLIRLGEKQIISANIARVPLHEAALLFKIATGRIHRPNSPRPQELLAMLDEIAQCLSVQERTS